ncbi:hypothetical protein [Stieleria varia]|uniref:Uncharacterized protein n=1 Tax=Stieleria varia TaxID=2528005 RepID=A0A5C6ATZ5_9BACT|nr:hypothetical protein [Stieleria varia]TWU02901.1 hypothetical protein Pla52n_39890 [Stieleria varia]
MRVTKIATDLTEFDVRDLAQKVGGSQLLPENADYYIELTRAAAVVGSLAHDSSLYKMDGNTWRSWINSGEAMFGGPEMPGDPHEGLFVSEVPFYGGGYYTIPSANPEDPFVLEVLAQASVDSSLIRDTTFRKEAVEIVQFGLYLSHQCMIRAGLTRTSTPGESENDDIRWPAAEMAMQLQEAVTFNKAEIIAEMERRNIGSSGLDRLTFELGSISATYPNPLANPTLTRPIAVTDEELIVVAPTNFLPAIRDAVLKLAKEKSVLAELSKSVEAQAWVRAMRFFEIQSWAMVGRLNAQANNGLDVGIFQFDDDKLAVVHLVVDDLTGRSRGTDESHWDLSSQLDRVQASAAAVDEDLHARADSINEVMHVVVIQGTGRFHSYSPPELAPSGCPTVCLTLDELRIVSQLNSGDPLALWQFGMSKRSKHGMARMLGAGFLDQYAQYRQRDSFYFGDDGIPDMVIFSGPGVNVRLEAQKTLDPHLVRIPDRNAYGRVYRAQNIADYPIYMTDPLQAGPVRLLIEELPIPVWVISPGDGADVTKENSSLCFHLADVIAFWIWQLTPTINQWCEATDALPYEIVIGVHIESPEEFFDIESAVGRTGFESTVDENRISIRFDSAFALGASELNNRVERELARKLLVDVSSCLAYPVEPEEIDAALATQAPLGLKRRMKTLSESDALILDNSGLPPVRRIQSFEMERIRDESGEVATKRAVVDQQLSTSDSHKIHNDIVGEMFNKLEAEIARFDDSDLLPNLISRHESLIAELRRTESIVGTHLSTMGDTPENRQLLQSDLEELNRASMASRFLLEYVSAVPPSGSAVFSTSAYDRVLAIASEIIECGFLSDGLNNNLSEIEVNMTASQRLKFGNCAYADAAERIRNDFYESNADASLNRETKNNESETHRLPEDEQKIDKLINDASVAEFGMLLEEIGALIGGIGRSQFTEANGIGSAREVELIDYLEGASGITRDLISQVVEQFAASPRRIFLEPPKPYTRGELWPWRFNRGLSYLRKPLIRRENTLTWGRRSLIQSVRYLCDLVTSGRIKSPKSEAMRILIGTLANRRGKQYDRKLVGRVSSLSGYIARPSMTEFNGNLMKRADGDPIGDVDVFVLDANTRTILPVEAKAFALAKTPSEVKNEFDALFTDTEDEMCAVSHHLERVAWMQSNIADVLAEFGVDPAEGSRWKIEPLLVLDSDLLSRHLTAPPFPVMTEKEFIQFLRSRKSSAVS